VRPPLAPVDLLALYWSRQVCILALPADSLEYVGEMAVGNIGGGLFDGVAGGLAAVVEPHSSFRNWFQDFPPSVPPDFAALYFALHSCIVSALTPEVPAKEITAANAAAQTYIE